MLYNKCKTPKYNWLKRGSGIDAKSLNKVLGSADNETVSECHPIDYS